MFEQKYWKARFSVLKVYINPNNELVCFASFWFVKYIIENAPSYLFAKCKKYLLILPNI